MGKAPAFQFYPNDWTRYLEEHPLEIEGAWIRICCKLWWSDTKGKLTKTIPQWSRILRTDEENMLKILNYIQEENIGDIEPQNITSALQDHNCNGHVTVICRRMWKDNKERELTRLRVQKYRGKNPSNAPVTPMKQHSSSSSSTSIKKKHKKEYEISLPKKVTKEVWDEFKKHRTSKKAPLTNYAEYLMAQKLLELEKEGYDPVDLINKTIEKGWQDINPEWLKIYPKGKKTPTREEYTHKTCKKCGKPESQVKHIWEDTGNCIECEPGSQATEKFLEAASKIGKSMA